MCRLGMDMAIEFCPPIPLMSNDVVLVVVGAGAAVCFFGPAKSFIYDCRFAADFSSSFCSTAVAGSLSHSQLTQPLCLFFVFFPFFLFSIFAEL